MRIAAIIFSIMILLSVARGGVYVLQDDVMSHKFRVNTDGALYRYGNQLLLPAIIYDLYGNIITTDAMVTYDTRHGNINLMHYGNYCILAADYPNIDTPNSRIAQTSANPDNIKWAEDHVYKLDISSITLDKKLSQFVGKQDVRDPISEAGFGKGDVINTAEKATDPATAVPKAVTLTSGFGHRYYLYDSYRIGDPNFEFYLVTMVAQSDAGPADGLLFLQRLVDPDGNASFLVIITVFESDWINAYSMAGIFDPNSFTVGSYLFAVVGENDSTFGEDYLTGYAEVQ